MTDPKRIPVFTMKERPTKSFKTLAEVAMLRAHGLGYEDIAAKLDLDWREVRPFVIPRRFK